MLLLLCPGVHDPAECRRASLLGLQSNSSPTAPGHRDHGAQYQALAEQAEATFDERLAFRSKGIDRAGGALCRGQRPQHVQTPPRPRPRLTRPVPHRQTHQDKGPSKYIPKHSGFSSTAPASVPAPGRTANASTTRPSPTASTSARTRPPSDSPSHSPRSRPHPPMPGAPIRLKLWKLRELVPTPSLLAKSLVKGASTGATYRERDLHRRGVPTRCRGMSLAQNDEAFVSLDCGWSLARIGARFGVPAGTVGNHLASSAQWPPL